MNMMQTVIEIWNTFEFQALFKLGLGALLTGIIGLERSALIKPAGFGTHAILGVSAVLIVLISEYLTLSYNIDMSRIPSQLLPGIGFIGAGTILRNGLNVKGVTTASAILAVTCIGLAVGAGFYIGAIVATIIVYLILSYAHDLSSKVERFVNMNLEIAINQEPDETIIKITNYFSKKNIDIKGIKRSSTNDNQKESEIIEITICYDSCNIKRNAIISNLIEINGVKEIINQD